MPVALISASTRGSIRPGGGGGATIADVLGQVLALRRVEDREALQERNRGGFLAGLARAPLLVVRHETVGINDGRAVLALAHIAAERERLAEGQPALAGIAMLDDSAPEDQHIDPGILPAGGGVPWHGERRLRRGRAPGLDPGQPPSLQLADDLGGDLVVQAGAAVAGLVAVLGHRGSPRRAPEASPPALNPSRQTRSALSL